MSSQPPMEKPKASSEWGYPRDLAPFGIGGYVNGCVEDAQIDC
jgi:hypothetical protein